MISEQAGIDFVREWERIQLCVHRTAQDHGWWEEERSFGTLLALVHSEISEALEAGRRGNPADDHIPDFTGVEAELADAVIRIMDLAEAADLDVAGALIAKARYNEGRSFRHGRKLI
jgi:NTP pyrophosphatase (non-canonical NTP hydrolase)